MDKTEKWLPCGSGPVRLGFMRNWGLLALLLVGCGAGAKNANRVDMPNGGVVDTAVAQESEQVDPDRPEADRARAHEHLPGDCDVVVRLRLDQLATAPSIRNKLVPAFVANVEKDGKAGELQEFFDALGIDPAAHLHGAVACVRGVDLDDPEFVVAIGGDIPPGKFVPAVEQHAKDDEFRRTKVGSMVVLEEADGHAFLTQCEDGTILGANRVSLLTASFERGRAFERYDIPFDEQIVVLSTPRGTRALLERFGSELKAIPPSFVDVRRVELFGSLTTGRVGIELELPSEDQAEMTVETVEMVKGQRQTVVAQSPELGPIFDSLEARADGARFTATVVVPEDLVDQFVSMSVSELGD